MKSWLSWRAKDTSASYLSWRTVTASHGSGLSFERLGTLPALSSSLFGFLTPFGVRRFPDESCYPKLLTTASSSSYVSKTVKSLVIASRSCMRLVKFKSLSSPFFRLTVV